VPENQWIVVENTHEAIIKQEVFDEVRRMMEKCSKNRVIGKGKGRIDV
jgi:hypothetical protein